MMAATVMSNSLETVLTATLSPDHKSRQAAEQHLTVASRQPGFISALLQVILATTSPAPIRLSASVFLKNFVAKHWCLDSDSKDSIKLEDGEKEALKQQILPAMVHAANMPQVASQLREIMHNLVRWEFPERWGSLLDQINQSLMSESSVCSGLIALYEVFNWKGYDNDAITEEMHARFTPLLMSLAQTGLSSRTDAGYEVARWVCKCFRAAIQYRFSYPLLSHFDGWHELFTAIIAMPTAGIKAEDMEELEEMRLFRLKKAALQCQNKVFSRYGISKKSTVSSHEHVKAFSAKYMMSLAPLVVQLNMKLIEEFLNGKAVITDSMFMLLCDLLEDIHECKPLWKSCMQGHALPILQHFLFPKVCFSADDEEEWQADPVEYIRSNLDPYEEFETPPTVALNLIVSLAKKHKTVVMSGLLAFLNSCLPSNNPSAPAAKQEGALRILGSLAKSIDKALNQSSELVESLLLPIMASSSHPLVQMRAAWCLEQFATEVSLSKETSLRAFATSFDLLKTSQDLAVRVQTAITVGALLDEDAVQEAAATHVLPLMERVLDLTNSVDIEALSALIEKLVNMYASDLAPYAGQLATQLANTFYRMLSTLTTSEGTEECEFEGAERMMSAIGLMRALSTLASSMSASAEILGQLEPVLVPLLVTIFERRVMDVYEEAFTLACELTFYRKQVSFEGYWRLYDLMFALVERPSGMDYISDVCTVLDNFATYASAQIMAQPARQQALLAFVQRVMSGTDTGYLDEYNNVCTMLCSLFLSQPSGLPVQMILPLLEHRMRVETEAESKESVCKLLHVYLSCLFHYHSLAVVQSLPTIFWEQLVKHSRHFTRVFDKRLVICGLAPILEHLPNAAVLQVYLSAIQTLPKALAERQKLLEQSDDDSDFDWAGYDSEDEAEESEGETPSSKPTSNVASKEWTDEDGEDDEDDDGFDVANYNDDEIFEEEFNVETPLDHLDITQVIQRTLPKLTAAGQLVSALPHDQQLFLKSLLP